MATKRITVESIGSYFESLPDPRHTQNRKHLFIDFVIAVKGNQPKLSEIRQLIT